MIKKFIHLFALLLIVISCQKQKAKKYAGIYECEVKFQLYEMGGILIDSTYTENVVVKTENENIIVLNETIDVSELKKDEFYRRGDYSNYFEVYLVADSLYFYRYSGGQGGISSTSYKGVRIE